MSTCTNYILLQHTLKRGPIRIHIIFALSQTARNVLHTYEEMSTSPKYQSYATL